MNKRSYENRLAKIDRALALAEKKEEVKIFVVQSAEQERDIRSEFSLNSSAKIVLIKCY